MKVKRTIQNTPTSKINTGAVGTNVEVKGRVIAEKDKLVRGPISGKPCAIYHIEIQKWDKDGEADSRPSSISFDPLKKHTWRRGRWVTIGSYFSDDGFYIDDDSGANAMVLVEGAKVHRDGDTVNYECSSHQFSGMDAELYQSLKKSRKKIGSFKLKDTTYLFSKDYHFREWCFVPGEELYVLGYASSNLKALRPKKPGARFFVEAKKMIRKNKDLQNKLDSNRDGKLDYYELERGAQLLAKKLATKYSEKKLEELASKTKMVFKKEYNYPFVISNRHEEDLVSHVGKMAALKIWGGPALVIGCTIYFFTSFFH
ncbi:hypothetical protein ACTRW9_12345 [Nitrospina sp. 32_T5]